MKKLLSLIILVSGILLVSSATKVIELSDRFLELRGDSTWIIMFYAPWCGHCKKLEPVWNHVAQTLYNTEIRAGKVDCTRFTVLATHFKIKGFPTIMFIKGETYEIYRGDRTKDEILGFALRMASARVPHLDTTQLEQKTKEQDLFFIYAGNKDGDLWDSFYSLALDFRHFHYFYIVDAGCMETISELESVPAVMVYKDESFSFYPVPDDEMSVNITTLNQSLALWINNERFPLYMKVTQGNLPQLWKVNKLLALTVVEENKIGDLKGDADDEGNSVNALEFKDNIHKLIMTKRAKYHAHFQFGWTGTPDIVNSIAMERLPLPCFIVIDTLSMNHFLPPEAASTHMDEAALENFLDSVLDRSATAYGGNSLPLRTYRMYYNAKTSLEEMWLGNPVLTAVLFGLPLGFLSLICYSIWCSDILDADDDDEEPVAAQQQAQGGDKNKPHEKKE